MIMFYCFISYLFSNHPLSNKKTMSNVYIDYVDILFYYVEAIVLIVGNIHRFAFVPVHPAAETLKWKRPCCI